MDDEYDVTCNISDLAGTCVITNDRCSSYTSTPLQQTVTPVNANDGSKLKFTVTFTTGTYSIDANLKKDGEFKGKATLDGDDSDVDDDNWAATAHSPLAAAAKSE